jgi:hypothetical protein
MALRVDISVRITPSYNDPSPNMHGDLTIQESFQIEASNFLEMSAILGQFHELAQKVKVANGGA